MMLFGRIYYNDKPYCQSCGAEMTSIDAAQKAICFAPDDCAICGREFKPKQETDIIKAFKK
jgi:hypothetical protein